MDQRSDEWISTKVLFCFVLFCASVCGEASPRVENNGIDFDIDNLLSSLDTAVDSIFDLLGDADGCVHKCPNGEQPVPNPHHKPSSNGCGISNVLIDTTVMPGVTKCCDKHDFCYDTCNFSKEKCDDKFQECLLKICHKLKNVFSEDALQGCKTTADLMYAGVMALGCKPYRESQKEACLCPKSKNKTEL
ncbi:group XIIA secretory phospholipase A2 [Patella vulgata]|uniref:group XIIA secretory phospholipase A2 n=1 Tax=Patella vulgata TaxID=6465 RepID=UPI00217FFCC8|nr:group XIIA secretory phospholipase A2 [Patella vulgata]